MQQLLTIKQVATLLVLSPVTVTHWSYGRRPAPAKFPSPIKVGRQVRYLAADVDDWILAKCGRTPTFTSCTDDSRARRPRGRPRKLAMPAVRNRGDGNGSL